MAFRAAHAVYTSHVAQPAGWFTGWSPSSRPDSEEAWSTSTSSWMWPSPATPSPALRHTAQEGRPGARGSPEQERREPEEGGSQKRWRGRRGGSCSAHLMACAHPISTALIVTMIVGTGPCFGLACVVAVRCFHPKRAFQAERSAAAVHIGGWGASYRGDPFNTLLASSTRAASDHPSKALRTSDHY